MQYTCRSSRDYYKQYLKGAFINHSDENLPERIEQLFQGARKDADYLLTKVWTPRKHVMSFMMLNRTLKCCLMVPFCSESLCRCSIHHNRWGAWQLK